MVQELAALLQRAKTVAVVGISDKPDRPSYEVAEYLEQYFHMLPVNPALKSWKGKPCYASLSEIPVTTKIDIVDIFRRSDLVLPLVEEAIARPAGLIWLQQGVINNDAQKLAMSHAIPFIMDACLAVFHAQIRSRATN